jgi:hypothetical protein
VFRRIALLALAGVAIVCLAVPAADARPKKKHVVKKHVVHRSTRLLVGINDEADTLYGDPAAAFAQLHTLKTQVLRVNLYWGGTKWAVANTKPLDATDPGDPAYDWRLYDRLVRYADTYGIKLVFSIVYTPGWANGGKARTVPPKNMQALRDFAHAAGVRYSGYWSPPSWQEDPTLAAPGTRLPFVGAWTAWNEPNNPGWLAPQYKKIRGKWRPWAAMQYAKICNTVYSGIHSVTYDIQGDYVGGEQVACGVTDPRGNNVARGARSSIDPLSFLVAAHAAGMKKFDVYAHNPYASSGKESPKYVPKGKAARRVQMGNLNTLLKLISKYYGPKHLWITEFGVQTNPPDKTIFGTSWKNQALYLKQAWQIAHANPRVDMFLWFLVKDEPKISGWQSGLMTFSGKKKPAWNTFRALPRG